MQQQRDGSGRPGDGEDLTCKICFDDLQAEEPPAGQPDKRPIVFPCGHSTCAQCARAGLVRSSMHSLRALCLAVHGTLVEKQTRTAWCVCPRHARCDYASAACQAVLAVIFTTDADADAVPYIVLGLFCLCCSFTGSITAEVRCRCKRRGGALSDARGLSLSGASSSPITWLWTSFS
jgi:RING-type zinc-finger